MLTKLPRLAILLLAGVLSAGCGTKGDLVLPQPEAGAAHARESRVEAPAESPLP